MFKDLALLGHLRNFKGLWVPASTYLYREKWSDNPPDKSVKSRQKNHSCIRHPVYYCNILVYRNFILSVIQWQALKFCKSRSFLETAQATFCTVSWTKHDSKARGLPCKLWVMNLLQTHRSIFIHMLMSTLQSATRKLQKALEEQI